MGGIIEGGQRGATIESSLIDGDDTFGQVDNRQTGAACECMLTNNRYRVGDLHRCNSGQIVESLVADLGYGSVTELSGNDDVIARGSLTNVLHQDSGLTLCLFEVEGISLRVDDVILSLLVILHSLGCVATRRTRRQRTCEHDGSQGNCPDFLHICIPPHDTIINRRYYSAFGADCQEISFICL